MPVVRIVQITRGHPDGTLTTRPEIRRRVHRFNIIEWNITGGSGVDEILEIRHKSGTNVFDGVPYIENGNWRVRIRNAPNHTEMDYAIRWRSGNDIKDSDPKITVMPTTHLIFRLDFEHVLVTVAEYSLKISAAAVTALLAFRLIKKRIIKKDIPDRKF